jgi:hypothetical protein
MTRPSTLAYVAIAAALTACSRSAEPERTENQVGVIAGSLYLTLETDQSTYRPGEPIALLLKLNNRSSRDTTLQFSSGQRYDFQIAGASGGGATAWTWSADRGFIQVLGSESLAADGALEYREQFTGQLGPGQYTVTGSITTMGSPLQVSTTVTVQ